MSPVRLPSRITDFFYIKIRKYANIICNQVLIVFFSGGGGGPGGPRRYSRDCDRGYDRGYDRGGYDRYDDREYYRSYR